MFSFVFPKILHQTIHIPYFEEDNRECIDLVSQRVPFKQYISKILKKTTENVFICFPKNSLSNNTYPKF